MTRPLPVIHGITNQDVGPLHMEQLDLEFANGERRQYHRQVSRGDGAVVVVPMLDDETVLLVREYAAGVHRYELGLVKGRIDAGETPEHAADRELKEEAGYGAKRIDVLRTLSLAPTYMSHQTYLVLARDLYPEKLAGDEPEELEVLPWKLHKLDALMLREDFSEGRSLAALFIVREWLGARGPAGVKLGVEQREAVIALAELAAQAILDVYAEDFAVEHKADASPLTRADLASHRIIVDGLQQLTPHWPVLSEEGVDIPWRTRRQWQTYWLVDPLDGTREFVKRNDEFSVNIALIHAHESVFGVVQQPTTGEVWCAAKGEGTFKRERPGDIDRPLHARRSPSRPLRVAASRSHRDARTQAFLDKLGDAHIVALGSSLKFCRIAEGALDVYPRFGPTSEWDTAAGQCVLEGAGGVLLTPKGMPFHYNLRDSLLNGDFIALGDADLPWQGWL